MGLFDAIAVPLAVAPSTRNATGLC